MTRKKGAIGVGIYLLIGLILWQWGYIDTPTFKEEILTFLYIVFLWPLVVLLKLLHG